MIRCRENLSNRVPTSGPTIEYGSKTTAKAAAADFASGWRSGENKTKDARADWKIPSVNWPVQRIAKSFRMDGIRSAFRNLTISKRSNC